MRCDYVSYCPLVVKATAQEGATRCPLNYHDAQTGRHYFHFIHRIFINFILGDFCYCNGLMCVFFFNSKVNVNLILLSYFMRHCKIKPNVGVHSVYHSPTFGKGTSFLPSVSKIRAVKRFATQLTWAVCLWVGGAWRKEQLCTCGGAELLKDSVRPSFVQSALFKLCPHLFVFFFPWARLFFYYICAYADEAHTFLTLKSSRALVERQGHI